MNRILFLTLLSFWGGASLLGLAPEAFAGSCTICFEASPITHTIRCSLGHEIDGECLANQVHSTVVSSHEQAQKIISQGFPCYGLDPKGHLCKNRLPLTDVSKLLHQSAEGTEVLANLNKMLASATSSSCMEESSQAEIAHESHESKVRQFRDQVLEAFNMCCPNASCGGGLAQIEGCNAATCEKCETKFCYLCLKPGTDSTAVHAHARAHSGNYWEHRDAHTGLVPEGRDYQEVEEYELTVKDPKRGQIRVKKERPYTYTDRYHWLIARGKLQDLFQKETDPGVRNQALESLKPILKKNKIWPMPAYHEAEGKMEAWTQLVLNDSSLDLKNKIALLQNELTYQHQLSAGAQSDATKAHALTHVELLKAVLLSLNAPQLTSLDVDKNHTQLANPNITPILPENQLYAGLHRDFIALGPDNIYQITDPLADPQRRVQPFILSHVTDQRMNQAAAVAFCAAKGGRLPTKDELDALKRAMSPQGRYNPDFIAGMRDTYFWSSSVHPDLADYFYVFYGNDGYVYGDHRNVDYYVRCVSGG
jgi:hypothetical protein